MQLLTLAPGLVVKHGRRVDMNPEICGMTRLLSDSFREGGYLPRSRTLTPLAVSQGFMGEDSTE